jgi:hypothetical protein
MPDRKPATPTGKGGTAKPASKPAAKAAPGAAGKPSPRTSGRSAGKAAPTVRPATAKPSAATKSAPTSKPAARSATALAASRSGGRKPPTRGGKSIVNQHQTPWGLIITAAVIVVFAIAVIGFALVHKKTTPATSNNPYTQPEIAAVKKIDGMIYKAEPDHTHVQTTVKYDTSPPIGGNHSPYWADCSGTVYAAAIANENAVHMLEHGAIWITYRPGLPAAQLAILTQIVSGVDRMALSPYPGLKTNVSLQAWDYQLFVDNASDPRIQQFIAALRNNPATTPEQGATCSQPTFKVHPSTFGHPLFAPAANT